jgi:hypothetical protein
MQQGLAALNLGSQHGVHVAAACGCLWLARQHQQQIQHLAQVGSGTLDHLGPLPGGGVQAAVADQQLGRAADDGDRRAQFVAGIGGELPLALQQLADALGVAVERAGQGAGSRR